MCKVFLSHSSRDNVQAEALLRWLETAEPALKDEIFFDRDEDTGIATGEQWRDALRKASDRCEAVICLVSQNWIASHECLAEYRVAEYLGKPVFPVRLEPTPGSDVTREWQHCDLFGDGPKTPAPPNGNTAPPNGADAFSWPPEGEPGRSPYRGWQPLESADAAVYFGRDVEINRALSAIRALRVSGTNKAFTILGPSGAGKSSFLRAGLLPRLRRDDRHFLTMDIVRPERHPLTGDLGLARSIHALRSSLGLLEPDLGVIKAAAGDPAQVRAWLKEAQDAGTQRLVGGATSSAPTLILPVDQAEELFGADVGAEACAFLTVIADLAGKSSDLPIMAVATIRTDRYELFQTAPQLAEVDPYSFEDLRPMRADRFREVICGPADRLESSGTRLRWAPEVVDALLKACDAGADALPLLSLTLARLYEDYAGDGEITLAEYEAMGGMRRVVETEIDSVLSTDAETRTAELEQLRRVFIPWLATINPINDTPLRRVARLFDLPADTHRLVAALVAKRLLVEDERDGEKVVEVALESLFRQWDVLAGWLHEQSADLKNADLLDQKVFDWASNGRQDDWLLNGAQLTSAETLAAKPGFRDRLNNAREFLLASRQREDERKAAALKEAQDRQDTAEKLVEAERRAKQNAQRRTRYTVVAALVTVVAVCAAAWGATERAKADRQYRDATALRLLGESQAMLAGQSVNGDDDVLAMQLLLAARTIAPNLLADSEFQLLTVLNQERDVVKITDTPAKVISVSADPGGGRIAAGTADGTVKLWDTRNGRWSDELLTGHDGVVTTVAFSPDGTRIASGSADSTVRVWSAETGAQLATMRGHQGPVLRVAWGPDGRTVASGGSDNTVRIWNAADGSQIAGLSGHTGAVNGVAFNPAGDRLASGSADGTIRIWDLDGRTEPHVLRGHRGHVVRVAWSPDGTMIASASTDGTARVWGADTFTEIHELGSDQNAVLSVAFSPDGTRIATGGVDRKVRLWDTGTWRLIGILQGHDSNVLDVAFTPDSLTLVSAGDSGDGTLRLWDSRSWQPIRATDSSAQYAMLRPGARSILAIGNDNTIRSWDTVTGRPVGAAVRFEDGQRQQVGVAGGRVLTSDFAGTVQLWNVGSTDGRGTRPSPTPLGKPLRVEPLLAPLVAYNASTRAAVVPTDPQTVQLVDVTTSQPASPPITLEHPVTAIALSPDGSRFAVGETDSGVRIWNAGGGPASGPLAGDGPVTGLTFSPDGQVLAVWSDRTLRLWDTGTSLALGIPMKTGSPVTAVAFSADQQLVAAGGQDGSIALFDIRGGRALPRLDGQNGSVTSLEFSPSGTRLVSASTNGTVRVWPVTTGAIPGDAPNTLCTKLSSNMSEQQWELWVPRIAYQDQCSGLPKADETGRAS